MAAGLGYGSGLTLRQTVRNNDATGGDDIKQGEVVDLLLTAVGSSGVGDEVLLGSKASAAPAVSALGIAGKDMDKGDSTATAEGQWGHVIVFGMCKALAGATIAAGDALAVEVTTGRLMKATAAQINAGEGVGVALAAAADGNLFTAFVNFINRDNAGSSGYGGAET